MGNRLPEVVWAYSKFPVMKEQLNFPSLLEKAIQSRAPLFVPVQRSAFRLFNGFTEGEPNLVIDLYASTLVFHNYAEQPAQGMALVQQAKDLLLSQYTWIRAGILKTRMGKTQEDRRGTLMFGEKPDRKIREIGRAHV